MDFSLTEEQEMLKTMARDFLVKECPKKLVREMAKDGKGYPPEMWKKMAELGWMGLPFPEAYGGTGGSFFDLSILLEEMGRACLPGPFFSTVVLAGYTILEAGSEQQKKDLISRIAKGSIIATLALLEPSARFTPDGIQAAAKADGKGDYVINGAKLFVSDANVADYIICAARTKPGDGPDGISLFLVEGKAPGLTTTLLTTLAGDKQCEVVLKDVKVPAANLLGKVDKGWSHLAPVLNKATAAMCSEMVGGAQQVLDMAVEYAKTRVQFGKPIGAFQAIQHHCANMVTDVDGSRFITSQAAWMVTEGLPCDREVAMAKAWVSNAFRRVAQLGHQIHGAIGFTEDHDMPLYFKRAKAWELAFGDADFHLEKLSNLMFAR